MQDYDVALEPHDRMLLDALIRIKAQRRHAVVAALLPRGRVRVGRDEHQRQERARLHHQAARAQGAGRAAAAAGPAGDPRPDRRHDPVLQAVPLDQAVPGQRHAAAGEGAAAVARRSARSWTACTSASCAPAARPPARRSGGIPDKFVGPAGLLQAYRFIADTRDQATSERLDNLEDPYRLFRCHYDHELRGRLPEGPQPDAGDRQDQGVCWSSERSEAAWMRRVATHVSCVGGEIGASGSMRAGWTGCAGAAGAACWSTIWSSSGFSMPAATR